jgi:hypothetical protein
MTDEQLSALLRIKRFEQPPPQYFDRLLENIHRRQRTDLLRLPLWKIAAERLQTFFGEHSMGNLSYAGALASLLVVGVTTIGVMTPGGSVQRAELAGTDVPVVPENRFVRIETARPAPAFGSTSLPTASPGFAPAPSQPRYIIDARPVSYDPSSL